MNIQDLYQLRDKDADRTGWQSLVEKSGSAIGEVDDSDESTTEAEDDFGKVLYQIYSYIKNGNIKWRGRLTIYIRNGRGNLWYETSHIILKKTNV